jgi:hypothetical protein
MHNWPCWNTEWRNQGWAVVIWRKTCTWGMNICEKTLGLVHFLKEICWRMCLCFLLKGRIWVAVGSVHLKSFIECLLKTDQPAFLSFLCAVNLFHKSLFCVAVNSLDVGMAYQASLPA